MVSININELLSKMYNFICNSVLAQFVVGIIAFCIFSWIMLKITRVLVKQQEKNKEKDKVEYEITLRDIQEVKKQLELLQQQKQEVLDNYSSESMKLTDLQRRVLIEENKYSDLLLSNESLRKTSLIAGKKVLELEKENQELDYYKLQTSELDLHDIKILHDMGEHLNNKNLVDKLIWQYFYQKQSKALFQKILGVEYTVCGIYKITNTATNQSYIGQSVNILDRWTEHIKNGLYVGKVKTENKLYGSMHKYGIENFAWELLEECAPEELDTKEKFYIQSLGTDVYGLNATAGNSWGEIV